MNENLKKWVKKYDNELIVCGMIFGGFIIGNQLGKLSKERDLLLAIIDGISQSKGGA